MELIERNRLHDLFVDTFCGMELITLNSVLDLIDDAPAAAAPVIRGKWNPGVDEDPEEGDYDHYNWTCSACHEEICCIDPTPRKHLPRYCLNCGAQMVQ